MESLSINQHRETGGLAVQGVGWRIGGGGVDLPADLLWPSLLEL